MILFAETKPSGRFNSGNRASPSASPRSAAEDKQQHRLHISRLSGSRYDFLHLHRRTLADSKKTQPRPSEGLCTQENRSPQQWSGGVQYLRRSGLFFASALPLSPQKNFILPAGCAILKTIHTMQTGLPEWSRFITKQIK